MSEPPALLLLLAQAAPAQSWWDPSSPLVSGAVLLLATLALELPMVLVAWRFLGSRDRVRPWLVASILGNLLSHPTAVHLGTMFNLAAGGIGAIGGYLVLESGVILLETWIFRWRATTLWSRALIVALAANAVTALLGAQMLFGS